MSRLSVLLPLAILSGLASCFTPSDQSADLRVVLEPIPNLFARDTIQPVARVVDASGDEVRGLIIKFGTSDPAIAGVTPDGRVFATGTGTVTVLAWAPDLEQASPGQTVTVVHGAVEIDSVLPRRVRYGSRLQIYGIGLDPSGAAVVQTGGLAAPIGSYRPADPAYPDRHGVLEAVFIPPLGQNSDEVSPIEIPITVTTTRGAATRTSSLIIEPRDIYEPNDSVPTDLGVISGRFEVLGLAFDKLDPSQPSLPVDWYSFTTATGGDWTITLRSVDAWRTFASADVIDGPLSYTGFSGSDGPSALWYIDRPFLPLVGINGTCGGFNGALDPLADSQNMYALGYDPDLFWGTRWSVRWPQLRWVLEGLPAGTHHLLIGFTGGVYATPFGPGTSVLDGIFRSVLYKDVFERSSDPIRYDLLIEPGIHAGFSPDRFEGNDLCENAPTLISLGAAALTDSVIDNLTIDAELDYDWFVIDAQTPGRLFLTVESDEQQRNASPFLLSPTPGVRQPVTQMYFETWGRFDEEQLLRSWRDGEPGVSLGVSSYYLVIRPGTPRSYRMRIAWMPGAGLAHQHTPPRPRSGNADRLHPGRKWIRD